MREKLLVVWNLIAAWLLALGLLVLMIAPWMVPADAWISLILVPVVVAALVAYLTRRDAARWAHFLLVVVLGVVAALAVFVNLLLFGAVQYFGVPWLGVSIAIGCGVLLLFFILTHRSLKIASLAAAVIVVLTLVAFKVVIERQEERVRHYAELWRSKGWPVEASEIFTRPATRERCEAWVEACRTLTEGEWEDYSVEVGRLTGSVADVLGEGGDLAELVTGSAVVADERWQAYAAASREALALAGDCPYLQWHGAEELADAPWDFPIPNLLGLIRWARGISVQALDLAAAGEVDQARELCLGLVDATRRLQIEGQILISSLISVAMERMAVVTLVGIQSIDGQPWPEEVREVLAEHGAADLSWAVSSVDVERYTVLKGCENPPGAEVWGFARMLPVADWEPLRRATFAALCERGMEDYTGIREWFATVPDLAADGFSWHDARIELPRHSQSPLIPDVLNIYARIINVRLFWHLALAVDSVYRHHAATGALPEAVNDLGADWPVDPFTGQPLCYRTVNDATFVVYSAGPDEIDQGGEPLYISGILKVREEQDVGFTLRVR